MWAPPAAGGASEDPGEGGGGAGGVHRVEAVGGDVPVTPRHLQAHEAPVPGG